jgi:hypothetical protein
MPSLDAGGEPRTQKRTDTNRTQNSNDTQRKAGVLRVLLCLLCAACVSRYLTDPNSILAVVTPATVDPSTSLALREARKVCAQN